MKNFHDLTEFEYNILKESGILFELYPEYEDFEFKQKQQLVVPEEIKNPDFSGLKKLVNEIVDYLVEAKNTTGFNGSDFNYMFGEQLAFTCIETFYQCDASDLIYDRSTMVTTG